MIPRIPTRVAALGYSEHRFRGYAVFAELTGTSYAALIALAVSGRRPTADETEALDLLAGVTTVADPRIWPLKLARLVASYGGCLAGFAASQLPLEGDRIGPPITVHAATMLVEMHQAVGGRLDDREACRAAARELVAQRRRLVGFGIPFRPADERYVALRAALVARGRTELPFWRLHEILVEVVQSDRGLPPNIGIGTAAMLLDMGHGPHEAAAIVHFINQHVFVANAFEGARDAREELRVLPASTIRYVGAPPRRSPRATVER